MSDRVLLLILSERTSARGLTYLSGWLGKAKMVGFKAREPDKYGNPVWEIFVSEPSERPREARQAPLLEARGGVLNGGQSSHASARPGAAARLDRRQPRRSPISRGGADDRHAKRDRGQNGRPAKKRGRSHAANASFSARTARKPSISAGFSRQGSALQRRCSKTT